MSASSRPLLSIIIATRNMGAPLRRCLDSIIAAADGIEVLVKDCLSSDDTVAVVQAQQPRFTMFRFICRPDTGICDAWNQTLTYANGPSGEWVLFLGADDFLCAPWRFRQVLAELETLPPEIEYAASPVILVDETGVAVDTLIPSRTLRHDLPNGMPLPHQGLFHRRRLFASHTFDASLRITGDYQFLCRTLWRGNLAYLQSPPAVCMTLGGVSGSLAGMTARDTEALAVSRRSFPDAPRRPLWKRIMLSRCFLLLARLLGEKKASSLADAYRAACGKTPIWNRAEGFPQALCLAPPQPAEPSADRPVFSLLIATVSRTAPLEKLLQSLCSQTLTSFQVLIADQNPPGYLDPLLEKYGTRLQLHSIRVPNEGVSKARNALFSHATGKYIAFPDDDCFYEPDVLEQAATAFDNFMHAHVLLGRWADPSQPMPPGEGLGRTLNWRNAFKRGETYVQFYRSEVVENIGGFDEELGPGTGLPFGGGEDTDYLLRAMRAGFTAAHAPGIRVRHPNAEIAQPDMNKIRMYALGRMHLLRKHGLPLWFRLANILYPLTRIPLEGQKAIPYRLAMFRGRLAGF